MAGQKLLGAALTLAATLISTAFATDDQAPHVRSIPMPPVGQIPTWTSYRIIFGDTDHDRRTEAILYNVQLEIWEEQGENVYANVHAAPPFLPSGVEDLDQDGKSEIVGWWGGRTQILESVDAMSYPTKLVWTAPDYLLGAFPIGDTDRDGHRELLFNGARGDTTTLYVVENSGDNSFVEHYVGDEGGIFEIVVADLDLDGRIEIALGQAELVSVYEAVANDTWTRTWYAPQPDMANTFGLEGGADTDGNGRPELFYYGNKWFGGGPAWTTLVFESTADDQFRQVAMLMQQDGSGGASYNALGNLDGHDLNEYIMETGVGLWIYQGGPPGNWTMVQQIADPDPTFRARYRAAQTFDANGNGRDEVFWSSESADLGVLILEYPSVSDAGGIDDAQETRLTIMPNPCKNLANVVYRIGTPGPTSLAVFDVAGRLVERRILSSSSAAGQFAWSTRGLAAGVYFLRLEGAAGRTLVATRAVVPR